VELDGGALATSWLCAGCCVGRRRQAGGGMCRWGAAWSREWL